MDMNAWHILYTQYNVSKNLSITAQRDNLTPTFIELQDN